MNNNNKKRNEDRYCDFVHKLRKISGVPNDNLPRDILPLPEIPNRDDPRRVRSLLAVQEIANTHDDLPLLVLDDGICAGSTEKPYPKLRRIVIPPTRSAPIKRAASIPNARDPRRIRTCERMGYEDYAIGPPTLVENELISVEEETCPVLTIDYINWPESVESCIELIPHECNVMRSMQANSNNMWEDFNSSIELIESDNEEKAKEVFKVDYDKPMLDIESPIMCIYDKERPVQKRERKISDDRIYLVKEEKPKFKRPIPKRDVTEVDLVDLCDNDDDDDLEVKPIKIDIKDDLDEKLIKRDIKDELDIKSIKTDIEDVKKIDCSKEQQERVREDLEVVTLDDDDDDDDEIELVRSVQFPDEDSNKNPKEELTTSVICMEIDHADVPPEDDVLPRINCELASRELPVLYPRTVVADSTAEPKDCEIPQDDNDAREEQCETAAVATRSVADNCTETTKSQVVAEHFFNIEVGVQGEDDVHREKGMIVPSSERDTDIPAIARDVDVENCEVNARGDAAVIQESAANDDLESQSQMVLDANESINGCEPMDTCDIEQSTFTYSMTPGSPESENKEIDESCAAIVELEDSPTSPVEDQDDREPILLNTDTVIETIKEAAPCDFVDQRIIIESNNNEFNRIVNEQKRKRQQSDIDNELMYPPIYETKRRRQEPKDQLIVSGNYDTVFRLIQNCQNNKNTERIENVVARKIYSGVVNVQPEQLSITLTSLFNYLRNYRLTQMAFYYFANHYKNLSITALLQANDYVRRNEAFWDERCNHWHQKESQVYIEDVKSKDCDLQFKEHREVDIENSYFAKHSLPVITDSTKIIAQNSRLPAISVQFNSNSKQDFTAIVPHHHYAKRSPSQSHDFTVNSSNAKNVAGIKLSLKRDLLNQELWFTTSKTILNIPHSITDDHCQEMRFKDTFNIKESQHSQTKKNNNSTREVNKWSACVDKEVPELDMNEYGNKPVERRTYHFEDCLNSSLKKRIKHKSTSPKNAAHFYTDNYVLAKRRKLSDNCSLINIHQNINIEVKINSSEQNIPSDESGLTQSLENHSKELLPKTPLNVLKTINVSNDNDVINSTSQSTNKINSLGTNLPTSLNKILPISYSNTLDMSEILDHRVSALDNKNFDGYSDNCSDDDSNSPLTIDESEKIENDTVKIEPTINTDLNFNIKNINEINKQTCDIKEKFKEKLQELFGDSDVSDIKEYMEKNKIVSSTIPKILSDYILGKNVNSETNSVSLIETITANTESEDTSSNTESEDTSSNIESEDSSSNTESKDSSSSTEFEDTPSNTELNMMCQSDVEINHQLNESCESKETEKENTNKNDNLPISSSNVETETVLENIAEINADNETMSLKKCSTKSHLKDPKKETVHISSDSCLYKESSRLEVDNEDQMFINLHTTENASQDSAKETKENENSFTFVNESTKEKDYRMINKHSPDSYEMDASGATDSSVNKDQVLPDNSELVEGDLEEGDFDFLPSMHDNNDYEYISDGDSDYEHPNSIESSEHIKSENLNNHELFSNSVNKIPELEKSERLNEIIDISIDDNLNDKHCLSNLPHFFDKCVTEIKSDNNARNITETNISDHNSSSDNDLEITFINYNHKKIYEPEIIDLEDSDVEEIDNPNQSQLNQKGNSNVQTNQTEIKKIIQSSDSVCSNKTEIALEKSAEIPSDTLSPMAPVSVENYSNPSILANSSTINDIATSERTPNHIETENNQPVTDISLKNDNTLSPMVSVSAENCNNLAISENSITSNNSTTSESTSNPIETKNIQPDVLLKNDDTCQTVNNKKLNDKMSSHQFNKNLSADLNNPDVLRLFNLAREIVAPEEVKGEIIETLESNTEEQTCRQTLDSFFSEMSQRNYLTTDESTTAISENQSSMPPIQESTSTHAQPGKGYSLLKDININVIDEIDECVNNDKEITEANQDINKSIGKSLVGNLKLRNINELLAKPNSSSITTENTVDPISNNSPMTTENTVDSISQVEIYVPLQALLDINSSLPNVNIQNNLQTNNFNMTDIQTNLTANADKIQPALTPSVQQHSVPIGMFMSNPPMQQLPYPTFNSIQPCYASQPVTVNPSNAIGNPKVVLASNIFTNMFANNISVVVPSHQPNTSNTSQDDVFTMKMLSTEALVLPQPYTIEPQDSSDKISQKIVCYKTHLLNKILETLHTMANISEADFCKYYNSLICKEMITEETWKWQLNIITIMQCINSFRIFTERGMLELLSCIQNSIDSQISPDQDKQWPIIYLYRVYIKLLKGGSISNDAHKLQPLHEELERDMNRNTEQSISKMTEEQKQQLYKQARIYGTIWKNNIISNRIGVPQNVNINNSQTMSSKQNARLKESSMGIAVSSSQKTGLRTIRRKKSNSGGSKSLDQSKSRDSLRHTATNSETTKEFSDTCLECKKTGELLCEACKTATYCSITCQQIHWKKEHYKKCENTT